MKLFNQLLVAPAALGLMAPISAIASEVNISEIAAFSEIDQVEEEIFDHNSFSNSLASKSSTEAMNNLATFEAGGFSDTTVATQSAQFLLSAAEGDADSLDEEAIQFNYYYSLSLDTSFTGEDNLNVGIEAGNTNASGGLNTAQVLDFGTSAGDTLKVVDINYTRSFGDLSVTVGDSLDASSQFSGACAYSGFTDHLSDCGTGMTAGLGGDVTVSSYDLGNGFVAGFGLTGLEGATTDGLFTKESIDAYAFQLAYSADRFGLAISYSDIDSHAAGATLIGYNNDATLYGFNGYYTVGGPIENISVGYEMGDPDSGNDTTNWFAGVTTTEVGPGTIGLGLGTTGHIADGDEETMQYEASYSWDVNDGIGMTVGAFIRERALSVDDISGVALTTTFSF